MKLLNLRRALIGTLSMGAVLGMTGVLSTPAQAEYPSKTVLTVVPFGAGGGTDRWARVMSSVGFDVFKEGMRIQNRGGAGGTIGWKYMLDKGPDGHTILLASPTPVIAAMLEKKAPFDPSNVKIVAYYSNMRTTVMAPKGKAYDSWKGFLKYIKTAKKKPTYGATITHAIGLANMLDQLGLTKKVIFVTYSGTGKAVNDYLGGHINMIGISSSTAITLAKKHNVIVNGSSNPYPKKVAKKIGKVPMASDLGLKPFNPPRFIAMHPDTPVKQVQLMSAKFKKLLSMKPVKKLMGKLGEQIVFLPHDQATAEYNKVLKSSRHLLKLLK
jgi:tripartite-type tricarboxylate transporter receptor subunit TctC